MASSDLVSLNGFFGGTGLASGVLALRGGGGLLNRLTPGDPPLGVGGEGEDGVGGRSASLLLLGSVSLGGSSTGGNIGVLGVRGCRGGGGRETEKLDVKNKPIPSIYHRKGHLMRSRMVQISAS